MSIDCRTYPLVLLMIIAGLLPAGCGGGGSGEHRVTGRVTFDGQPVEQGEIIFFTADMEPYVSQIVAGEFACDLPEGQKRVEITATRELPTPAADGLPNYESYIPAAYNTASILTADIEAQAENALTFELESRPTRR